MNEDTCVYINCNDTNVDKKDSILINNAEDIFIRIFENKIHVHHSRVE